ncbi:hypothetical protein YH66_09735 [[Brevibacterium] flavum]|uniref:Uncharacterized protein n=1 Tax=[Brevibacterium] flavum TaxID=92706 RepID=A0A0F6WR18_9CORY|nr:MULTISPECIES: hypothetical protein [Corynebacterium]AKF27811.1 hypothetical protein YH66_09735 [[Brevibacterium] flavum]ANE08643.1 hypothetical protein A3654_09795 [Corynebacterium glutamicum]AST21056.1 hypothetical protein CEY17_09875 [Corynebacterium glutamicum ATCC 14067]KEI23565.1 hypothetical protein KIQ_013645 [Corynebacterium glutamicum ATCC 14067]KIH73313.1 hypothetical protein SD36_09765 [Corynebacterium glutamicum]
MSLSALLAKWFNEEIMPALRKSMREAAEALAKIEELLEETEAPESSRTDRRLVTRPVDHTHAHVTHTSSKPPHGKRMYRRRTP